MLPLVALLALHSTEVTADEAFAAGTRILAAFDVAGPYRLDRSLATTQNGTPEFLLSVTAGDGAKYGVYVWKASGRCWLIQESGFYRGGMLKPRPSNAASPKAQVARATRGFARLEIPYPTLPAHFSSQGEFDSVGVSVAIDGHPFFNTSCGYSVGLNAMSGAFQDFSQGDVPPEVDRVAQKLTSEEALAAAKRIVVSDKPSKYDPQTHHAKPWTEYVFEARTRFPNFSDPGERRLGWFVPQGETRARLAWSVPYWSVGYYFNHIYTGQRRIMIDAATGQRLPEKPGTL